MATRVVLARRPDGLVTDDDFRVEEVPIDAPPHGHVVVAVDVLSIDAFIRTMLDEGAYHGTVGIGRTVTALGVGHVVASSAAELQVGDEVFGPLGAQTEVVLPAAALRRLDTSAVPATAYLGALGLTTGLTAYFGVLEVGRVQPGDTVVVSAAAGAVGSVAGQLARIAGATNVIGIAGGAAKTAFLIDELGFTSAIDRHADDLDAKLAELAPGGIDVFFDNVGGATLDSVLMQIREGARIVICGAMSQYGDMTAVAGPSNYLKLAERHARMEGFAVTHFAARFAEAEAALATWLADGRLVVREHLVHGIEQFPAALAMLFTGGHHGKLLLDLR
jgi:NADPH-dependent curcumin reductase CurA